MTSDAQTRANRGNAARSTGPKSRDGKSASSANALKHGTYASRDVAIPRGQFVEDETEIATYIEGLVASLAPRDLIEEEAAYRIAILYLRFRRLSRLEPEAIAGDAPTRTSSDDVPDPLAKSKDEHDMKRERLALVALQQSLSLVTTIDQRTATALQRALDAYDRLHRRTLPTDQSDEP